MLVKICGTTNLPDAQLAVELGAETLGFIFAPSKRRVSAGQAAEIVRGLPAHVERVGVFTEPDVAEIGRVVELAGLSAVQMHWAYDASVVAALREALGEGVKLWQVVGFAVAPADKDAAASVFAQLLRAAMLDARLAVVLLDAVKAGASGGLGEAFDWDEAGSIVRRTQEQVQLLRNDALPQLMLAGGLRADNVHEAVAAIGPAGVDVVSGVEASPGRKSPERLRAFVSAVRGMEQGLGR